MNDCINVLTNRCRLFLKDKVTVAVFILSIAVFSFMIKDMNLSADDRSAIPIGLVDDDNSMLSVKFSDRLKTNESLGISEAAFGELKNKLLDGYIRCILVIKKGYGKNIENGMNTGLIYVYRNPDDAIATVVTDIAAGDMMMDICESRTYTEFEKLRADGYKLSLDRKAFYEMADSIASDESYSLLFNYKYIKPSSGSQLTVKIKNSLIYRQAIACIAGIIITLILLFSMSYICIEWQSGMTERLKVTMQGKFFSFCGNILAAMSMIFIMDFAFTLIMCYYTGMFSRLFRILFYIIVFSAEWAVVFILLSYIICRFSNYRNGNGLGALFSYQIAGALMVLSCGALGFISMVDGILTGRLPAAFSYVPNIWFIDRLTEILINI